MAIIKRTTGTADEVKILPQNLDFKLYQGDSFDVSLRLKNARREVVDLSTFEGVVHLKDANGNIVGVPELTMNYGDAGVLRIYLANTTMLPPGEYPYDLQLGDSSGQRRTVLAGVITITGETR